MLEINSLFDESYYIKTYPEAKAQALGGLTNFLSVGRQQGYNPGPLFDTQYYLSTYPGVAEAVKTGKITALDHFIRYGQYEGRDPITEFNTTEYLQKNPGVAAAIATSATQPDPLTAYSHFINFGQFESRDISSKFNASYYLQANPGVAAAIAANPGKLSPLQHYREYGIQEGRAGVPSVPTPGLTPTNPTTSAFSIATDGFSFANYDAAPQYATLTPVEMRRLFGDAVLASPVRSDGSFSLTPTAEKWMEWANSTMKNGHCEGLAVLSLLMYEGKIRPQDFGAERAADLNLEGNTKLQREIAYWYATGLVDRDTTVKTSPNDVLAALRTSLNTSGSAIGTLRFSNPGGSGGHSVAPIGITDLPNDRVSIQVYDGNYPKENREIIIDTAANTWFYSPDATLTEDDYRGDAGSQTLGFEPIDPRLGTQPWVFSAAAASDANRSLRASTTIPQLLPDVNLTIPTITQPTNNSDVQPNNLFFKGDVKLIPKVDSSYLSYQGALGTLGNENNNIFPNAPTLKVNFPSSLRSWENPAQNYYTFSNDGFVSLDLTAPSQPTDSEFISYIGSGYVFEVDGLDLEPGQTDNIFIVPNDSAIVYNTQTGKVPELFLGFETPEADFSFFLNDFELEPNDAVVLDIDAEARLVRMRVVTSSPTGDTIFSLAMERIGDESIEIFDSADDGITLADNETLLIDYSSWDGNGKPLRVGYDANENGLLDKEEEFMTEDVGDNLPIT
ncbi:hypothetical protein PN499_17850 [Kamptonema animale CS-326]|jgi:hypothetical protein|uniref:hypothetical protein n=1 Tax=Kamptonema animale TaxID=92934 RepID=UPI00232C2029|nr:hypothetical protein [Kamptonema animale]MDB9513058.1 hypothetical protein [Kamptonema animale CS-326]